MGSYSNIITTEYTVEKPITKIFGIPLMMAVILTVAGAVGIYVLATTSLLTLTLFNPASILNSTIVSAIDANAGDDINYTFTIYNGSTNDVNFTILWDENSALDDNGHVKMDILNSDGNVILATSQTTETGYIDGNHTTARLSDLKFNAGTTFSGIARVQFDLNALPGKYGLQLKVIPGTQKFK